MELDARHRDKNGEISRKHGNTLIRTLRNAYGEHFAQGCADTAKLSDVLQKLDDPSLKHLIRDHETGPLGGKITLGVPADEGAAGPGDSARPG